MIQSVSLSRSPSPPDPPARAGPTSGRFTQSLAAFLDAGDKDEPEAGKPAVDGGNAAVDGKSLPDEERIDPLAWLAMVAPPPVPPPAPPVSGAVARPVSQPVAIDASVGPAPPGIMSVEGQAVSPELGVAGVGSERNTDGMLLRLPDTIAAPAAIEVGSTTTDQPLDNVAKRVDRFAVQVPVAGPVPAVAPPSPVTAAQVFGTAIREAMGQDEKHARADVAPPAPPPAQVEAQRHAVAATAEVQQAPLDMGHDRWPHRMIERIETMRDAADAVDTRIRLVPDALGAIDVSMRRDGDAVHVHFAVEQAATARLLTDAQPRLAELAEARGIRLGGSAVDSGGGDARHNRSAPPAPLPKAPAQVAAAPITDDDARIA